MPPTSELRAVAKADVRDRNDARLLVDELLEVLQRDIAVRISGTCTTRAPRGSARARSARWSGTRNRLRPPCCAGREFERAGDRVDARRSRRGDRDLILARAEQLRDARAQRFVLSHPARPSRSRARRGFEIILECPAHVQRQQAVRAAVQVGHVLQQREFPTQRCEIRFHALLNLPSSVRPMPRAAACPLRPPAQQCADV